MHLDGFVIMKRERGFSIVELMVAMLIAMVVLLVVSQVYVGSVTTQRAQTDVMRLNESARFAFDLISRELRLAGFRNTWQPNATASDFCSSTATGAFLFAVNDPPTINPAAASANLTSQSPQISIYSPAVNSYNDVLRVRYYGEDFTATAQVLDCHGQPVAANQLVQDTLFIAPDTNNNNEPTLFCYTDNPSPVTATHPGQVALVAGVESLQLLFGQDTDDDGIVNRYVPANLITNGGRTMDDALSVRVSILVRSPNSVSKDGTVRAPMPHFSANYPATTNSDGSAVFPAAGVNVPSDGRARQMLSTEIAIRNQRYCG